MEDEKGSPSTSYTNLRPKKPRSFDEMDGALWDCSVCTYKNNAEAFKCAICDTRKGTSTRKPKVNSQLVAQQTAQQVLPTPAKIQKIAVPRKINPSSKRSFSHSRLKNVDHSSEQQMEVTVGDVTVIITDYKLLPVKDEKTPPESPGQPETTATTIAAAATTEATTTPAESTETKLEQINGDAPSHPPLESKKTVGETSEHENSEVPSS